MYEWMDGQVRYFLYELTHLALKAKFYDLLSSSWKTREANGVCILVQVWRPESGETGGEANGVNPSLSLKA